MKNLEIILETLTPGGMCKDKLTKLIELNVKYGLSCHTSSDNSGVTYDFINSDGELVCILPYYFKMPVSQQAPFWFAILMTTDLNKIY